MLDLKVVGGTVVDGTGAAARTADVGIRDGRIVEVGRVTAAATRTLDADGALVTPGFVDLHTHYDGQASWDGALAPSSLHGVTTAVMGSCGVGFAPVHDADHDALVKLMEGVEDIPGTALHEGLTWGWRSYGEYLDALDAIPHTFDLAGHVPHDPLRVFVMRDRALRGEVATADDIEAMRAVLREALEGGAVGFSTGRSDNHRSADGDFTPAAEADRDELVGIALAFEGLGRGVLQAVSDFDMMAGSDRFDGEFDLLQAMAEAADGRPMSLSLMQRDHAPGQYRRVLRRVEAATAAGLTMKVQVAPRPIGVLLGLQATFHPFMGFPSYKEVSALPLSERVQALADPGRKARILSERSEPLAGDGSAIPPLADDLLAQIDMLSMRIFRLGDPPDYEPAFEDSLFAEAQRTQRAVLDVVYDALLEDAGRALLYFPLYNYTGMNLDVIHELLTHPLALPGLSDGGAHVGTICDATFSTTLMSYWGRDRPRDRLPIERIVQMQTADTADHLGFSDRGRLVPGLKADLNIIDFDRLRLRAPALQNDLPAGGPRLMQHAEGYRATVVSGTVTLVDDQLTGALPGRIVRLGAQGPYISGR